MLNKSFFVSGFLALMNPVFSQVSGLLVVSRSEINHGNWDQTDTWYSCGANRSRPDFMTSNWGCSGTSVSGDRHNVEFGHNNNSSQTINNAPWYHLNQLYFTAATNTNRTFANANNSSAGISITNGIYNHGTGVMTFNVPIGIDGNSTFQNTSNVSGSGGQLSFNSNIYVNDKVLTLIPQASGNGAYSWIKFKSGSNVSNGSGTGAKIIVSGTSSAALALDIEGTVNYNGILRIDEGKVVVSSGATLGGLNTALDIKVRGGTLDIQEDVIIKDLYISGGSIEINEGGSLTVEGKIYHTAGASTGIVSLYATTSTAPGQLLVKGGIYEDTTSSTLYDNGIHFRVLQRMDVTGHHAISSPFSEGFVASNFVTAGMDVTKLYGYDEANGSYLTSGSNLTNVGRGFFAPIQASGGFFTSGTNFTHKGSPNTAANFVLKHSTNVQTGGSGNNWNLIGNPYTCALNFTALSLGSYVNNACYLWDASTMKYNYYVSGVSAPSNYVGTSITPTILPYHGFWVQLKGTSPQLNNVTVSTTMSATGSISSSGSTYFYKNNPDNLILIAREEGDSTKADAMWLKNVAGTTLNFEGSEDAWKMTNYGGQPMIYSVDLEEKLAINAIDLNGTTVTPVGFSAPNVGGKYRITLEQVVNDLPYTAVLEDKLFGTFTDLTQGDYSFTHAGWHADGPRFALHTMGAALDQPDPQGEVTIAYQDGERIMVRSSHDLNAQLTISSLDGRVVRQVQTDQSLTAIDMAGRPSGIYLIEVRGSDSRVIKVIYQN